MIRSSACLSDHLAIRTYAHAAKAERPDRSPPRNVGPFLETTQEVERCASAYTYPRTGTPSTTPARRRIMVGGGVMGAANVAAALHLYAGKVPYKSMVLLLAMANTARDADAQPWYSAGHDVLAATALGRSKPTKRDIDAVSEGVSALVRVGAITVKRRGAPRRSDPSTALYHLHLTSPAALDAPGKTGSEHSRKNRLDAPGKTGSESPNHSRKNRKSLPEKPGPKEEEEEKDLGASGGGSAWGPFEPDPHAHPREAAGDPDDEDRPPSDPALYMEWMRRHRPNSPWLRSVK